MTMAVSHKMTIAEAFRVLGDKLGRGDLAERAFSETGHLLDREGLTAYLSLVDACASLDPVFSAWLLQAGGEILSSLPSEAVRREALGVLVEMGRNKWSVVQHACRKIRDLAGISQSAVVKWLRYCGSLADIDQDVALQYLDASIPVLTGIGPARFNHWAEYGYKISQKSWKAAKEYFRSSPEVIRNIDYCDLERWALLGIHLVEKSPRVKAGYDAHSLLAAGAGAGKAKKIDLAVQYFKSAPQILSRLSIHDLQEWVEKGLETVNSQTDKGASFFSLQTGASRMAVDGLVRGLELKDIHKVLRSYAESIRGTGVMIRSSSLFYKNLPGLSRFFSVTDGTRIFLPSRIEVFDDDDLNFKTYKWILTHELAHLLFGTFDIDPKEIAKLSQYKDPFPAFRLFEFLEDERVDYLMGLQFPGLEKDRRMIMEAYVAKTSPGTPELKQSFLGMLSLTAPDRPGPDRSHAGPERLLSEALSKVLYPGCSVREVLDLTLSTWDFIKLEADCAVFGERETTDRLFYRGILDFELVESARVGTDRLLHDLTERLYERKMEIAPESVTAALARMEEAQLVDSEELLWQIQDGERLNTLFDEVQEIIADMEAEKRVRTTAYYDEWDLKLDDYRKDWCRVREMDMPGTSPVFYHRTIRENYGLVSLLRRHFGLLRPDRIKRYFREERGDDIDFDAVIEAVVERHAGITPSDRVYIRREKNLRDVSVAFLVDMSYSTGDVLPSGKRIIDVEREGLVLMAEALESIGDRWAVYGFSTHYRDKVDFFIVRDFDEPLGREVKMRFESIRPLAQTRLGAAIRHANSLLSRQGSRIRLLILLSDGRPYDIDYGDSDYAVEDTRRALWEGRRNGVNSFCITVDKRSRDYLPYMYGEANYTLIDNVETLPARLPLIYKRLTT